MRTSSRTVRARRVCVLGPKRPARANPIAKCVKRSPGSSGRSFKTRVQILEEFGGLRAAMKRSFALEKQVRRQAPTRVHPPRPHLADGASRGGSLPMTGARLTAGLRCENDVRGRFTLWPPGDSHRTFRRSAGAVASCAAPARAGVAGRAARAVVGATPQSEGLVRVRRQVCFHNLPPSPRGRSHTSNPSAGRPRGAAVRRRMEDRAARPGLVPLAKSDAPSSMAPCQRSNRSGH